MDLTSEKTIKELLKEHQTRPIKKFGQNFLINKETLNKVVEASDLKPNDIVLEIGPGVGTLTQELAKRAKKVIAAEKDQDMIEVLKETVGSFKNTEIIQKDALKLQVSIFGLQKYKVVANLPYYITSPVIRKFLESPVPPELMVLVVQKDVAQRITAQPPDMNLLAVSAQFYAEPKIISFVPKEFFWPKPKVNGAILKIIPKQTPKMNRDLFFKIVKAGFAQPRKQIANNLSKKLGFKKETTTAWLLKNKIQPGQRAETLAMKDWINLAKNYPQAFVK